MQNPAFIVTCCSLSLSGLRAFVSLAWQHGAESQLPRPATALGYEDQPHPGKGDA